LPAEAAGPAFSSTSLTDSIRARDIEIDGSKQAVTRLLRLLSSA
jgi:hypothetical protein